MTDRETKLAEATGTLEKVYGQEVNKLIRERYTVADEIAILRQRDTKPEEFDAYNAFVEECKARVKAGH